MDEYLGMDEVMLSSSGRQDRGTRKKRQGFALILAGLFLIGAAGGLVGYNVMDDRKAGDQALEKLHELENVLGIDADGDGYVGSTPVDEFEKTTPSGNEDPGGASFAEGMTEEGGTESLGNASTKVDTGPVPVYEEDPDMAMPTIEAGGEEYVGFLRISAIDRTLPVMEEWSYPHLKIAPGVYQGTVYKHNLIICAHNYERHFGLIKTLKEGDKVIFVDGYGDIFRYHVDQVTILQPTQVDEMKAGDWDLTLFTCTIGGATRVTVRCVLDESEPSWWPKDAEKVKDKVEDLRE